MPKIHFLHISDLHFNKIGFETETMREKLPEYIQSLQTSEGAFDYVFFTGDLRYAPNTNYPTDSIQYFKDLCSSSKVNPDRLYVVIGNHDVVRGDSKRLCAITEFENEYYLKDRVISPRIISSLKEGRSEYYDLLRGIVSSKQYDLHCDNHTLHFVDQTEDINVVVVDSTITYRENKENGLIIGAYNLKRLLNSCDISKPTIILSHYALDDLETTEQKAILRALKDNHVQLWLAGHKHNEIIRKELDYIFTAQSGNQTFENGTSPGFIEGHLNTETGCGYFQVHKWNASAGWGLYQTLVDHTDKKECTYVTDKTKYFFVLDDWRFANKINCMCELTVPSTIIDFLSKYNGSSFFTDTLMKELNINQSELIEALNVLQSDGYIKPINYKKSHWEILKIPALF